MYLLDMLRKFAKIPSQRNSLASSMKITDVVFVKLAYVTSFWQNLCSVCFIDNSSIGADVSFILFEKDFIKSCCYP